MNKNKTKAIVESSEPTDKDIRKKLIDEMDPLKFYQYLLKSRVLDKREDHGLQIYTPEQMIFMDYHEDIDRNVNYTFLDGKFVKIKKQPKEHYYEGKREVLADYFMEYLADESSGDVIKKLSRLERKLGIDILSMFDGLEDFED
jgi:hypothetical protein